MQSLGHIRLISLYWSRYAVRSGSGLVYLMIALIFGLSVAHILIMPVEQLMSRQERETGQTDPEFVRQTIIDVGKPIVEFVSGRKSIRQIAQESATPQPRRPADPNDAGAKVTAGEKGADLDPWTSFLLERRPALLSAIFLVLLFGMPFVISFLAFNQVTGDIQSRGLRYLLLRTERSNIYFGRFLGAAIFSTAVTAVIVATIISHQFKLTS